MGRPFRKLPLFLVSYIHVVEFETAPSFGLEQIVLPVFLNHSQWQWIVTKGTDGVYVGHEHSRDLVWVA